MYSICKIYDKTVHLKQRKMTSSTQKNESRTRGQKKPFTPHQARLLGEILREEGNFRDLAMFCVGIDTMLRAGDLLKLTVADVMDTVTGNIKVDFEVVQTKTGRAETETQKYKAPKMVLVELSATSQDALVRWIQESGKTKYDYLFTGLRKSKGTAITVHAYVRIVKRWATLLRLNPEDYGTHSVRRSNASLIFESTNNPEVIRQLLGHTSISNTSYYLGVDKKKALEVARRNRIF